MPSEKLECPILNTLQGREKAQKTQIETVNSKAKKHGESYLAVKLLWNP